MSLNIEGHMGLKSSPLATTSCKLTKQFLVLQHINAHHKNLSNVKSSIDTSCPKSWYKNVNVKDQIKRENSARGHSRTRPSSAKSHHISTISTESPIYEDKVQINFQSPNSDRNIKDKPNDLTLEIEKEDIIDKNCTKFTDQKSFTPRILKNDKTPKLTQLRCYNPPKRKMKEKAVEKDFTAEIEPILFSEKTSSLQELPRSEELSEEEIRLKELDFLKDLTDDILIKHNFTDREVEQTCEYHIKRNKFGLKTEQMRNLCLFVIENTKGMPQYSGGFNKSYNDPYEYSEDNYQPQVESNVMKHFMTFESSMAPSTLQIYNDDLESNQHSFVDENAIGISKSNSVDLQNDADFETLRDTFDDIKLEEREIFQENNESIQQNLNEILNSDDKKNVHFASQNETFSAQETDRSLTDISPFQVDNSEDSATSLSLSMDMNKTFKKPIGTAYDDKMPNYDDDFE